MKRLLTGSLLPELTSFTGLGSLAASKSKNESNPVKSVIVGKELGGFDEALNIPKQYDWRKKKNFQIFREVVANEETCELTRENARVYRAYLYTGVSEKEIKSLHENNGIY